MNIVKGLRVDSPKRRNGVCTGQSQTGRSYPEDALRAEVVWPDGVTRWPLVRILTPAGGAS